MQTQRKQTNLTPSPKALEKRLEGVPPSSPEVERAALGAMLIDSRAAKIAEMALTPEDFYAPINRTIFETMLSLRKSGVDIDEVTLRDALEFENIENAQEITSKLIMQCPSATNVEGYIEVLQERKRQRAALIAAGKILLGSTIEEARRELDKAEKSPVVTSAGYSEVSREIEDEISGARYSVQFPDWPVLSDIGALMPEGMMLICGSAGVSKSFFALEPLWKLAVAGIEKVKILELEKTARFHVRRALAQISNRSPVTDSKWIANNIEEAREIANQYAKELEILRDCIFAPDVSQTADCKYLLRWLREASDSGYRVLVIDPVSIMAGQERRFLDHETFVQGAIKILKEYRNSIVCITHPRDTGNEEPRPALCNIPGSKIWERCCDTICWLEYHETTSAQFGELNSAMPRLAQEFPYNRTLHTLKVRSRHNPRRIAYWFNSENLRHVERGIIRDGF